MVVKRSHISENVAPAIRVLLQQVNAAYPNRLKTTVGHDSDGIWPSPSHTARNPNSDHEAGNALDIDDDLSGVDGDGAEVTPGMARRLSLHPSCHYTIHDGMKYYAGVACAYQGANPHEGHVHVSVYEDKRANPAPWQLEAIVTDYDLYLIHASKEKGRKLLALCETEHLAVASRPWPRVLGDVVKALVRLIGQVRG
ncbi:MAG: hypothetical protein U1E29_18325 [Coriobacteriia bacterium]|nr:hypothetical protein [Coriobacteriia bacterium]